MPVRQESVHAIGSIGNKLNSDRQNKKSEDAVQSSDPVGTKSFKKDFANPQAEV
jgi:hypothetical protein